MPVAVEHTDCLAISTLKKNAMIIVNYKIDHVKGHKSHIDRERREQKLI